MNTYKVEGGFVVADGYWLPGLYETKEVAEMAAKIDDSILLELESTINIQQNRSIKLCDLNDSL